MVSSSCMYRSSPPPPSTSWSNFRMISFSNCRRKEQGGEGKVRDKEIRRKQIRGAKEEEINYAGIIKMSLSPDGQHSVCVCASAICHWEDVFVSLCVLYSLYSCINVITLWKFPECACSQVIMSKKMGMVALLSSSSGIKVISRMGPTMPGMKQIL